MTITSALNDLRLATEAHDADAEHLARLVGMTSDRELILAMVERCALNVRDVAVALANVRTVVKGDHMRETPPGSLTINGEAV